MSMHLPCTGSDTFLFLETGGKGSSAQQLIGTHVSDAMCTPDTTHYDMVHTCNAIILLHSPLSVSESSMLPRSVATLPVADVVLICADSEVEGTFGDSTIGELETASGLVLDGVCLSGLEDSLILTKIIIIEQHIIFT